MQILEIKLSDLKDGMAKAYERFALRAGLYVCEQTMFDCTKIEVSKEIDDYFWKYYREQGKENNPNLSDEEIKTSIAMLMLQHGAKRNDELPPWHIKLEDGYTFMN